MRTTVATTETTPRSARRLAPQLAAISLLLLAPLASGLNVAVVDTNADQYAKDWADQVLSLDTGPFDLINLSPVVTPVAVQGEDFTIQIAANAGQDLLLPAVVQDPTAQEVTSKVDTPGLDGNCGFGAGDSSTRAALNVPWTNLPQSETGTNAEYEVYPQIYAQVNGTGGVQFPTSATLTVKMHAPLLPPTMNWMHFNCLVDIFVVFFYGTGAAQVSAVREITTPLRLVIPVVPQGYVLPLGTCDAVNGAELEDETATCVLTEVFDSGLGAEVPLKGGSEYIVYQGSIIATYADLGGSDDDHANAFFTLSYNGETSGAGQDGIETGESEGAKFSQDIAIFDDESQTICGGVYVKDEDQWWDFNGGDTEASDTICLSINYDQVLPEAIKIESECAKEVVNILSLVPVSILDILATCSAELVTAQAQSNGLYTILLDMTEVEGIDGIFIAQVA